MKTLHRPDLFSWSIFDETKNLDFHGYYWQRPEGGVMVDPVPMSEHDLTHVVALGGVKHIVVTNSDHTRATAELAERFQAEVVGPLGEKDTFPIAVDRWVRDGEVIVPGLTAMALEGSKTPGELALVLADKTLVTGDLVRAHAAGALTMLPEAKLSDPAKALESVKRLAALPGIEAVLVGDGWPVFRDGGAVLGELAASL